MAKIELKMLSLPPYFKIFVLPLPIKLEPTSSRLSFCLQIPLRQGILRKRDRLRTLAAGGEYGAKNSLSLSFHEKEKDAVLLCNFLPFNEVINSFQGSSLGEAYFDNCEIGTKV